MSVVIPSLRAAVAVPGWAKNVLWRNARAVPSLDLRFADNKSLVDAVTGQQLVTFTRASSGTFVDSAGTLQTAATDVPRFDHNPTTGESLGLLVEDARTNLLVRSEEFDNASWGKTRSSVTANATTSPAGTLTADKLVEDTTASNSHQLVVSPNTASGIYTCSVYAKAAERTQAAIRLDTGVLELAIFNLSTGTVISTTNGITSSITSVGNGWYRLTATTVSAVSVINTILQIAVGGTNVYTGDGTSGLFLWGAQLEAGAFATSYIPTTTAAATRAADVASITGSAFSSWYSQSEGTMFANAAIAGVTGASQIIVQLNNGTESNRMMVLRRSDQTASFTVTDGGSAQAEFGTVSISGSTSNAIAATYKTNDFAMAVRGLAAETDSLGTVPAISQLNIGNRIGGTYLNGTIRRLTYWPQALPSRLQSITL
jgi:hypothetical protein